MTIIRTGRFEGCTDEEPIDALFSLLLNYNSYSSIDEYVATLDDCDDENDIIEVTSYGHSWVELITTIPPKEVRWYAKNHRVGVQYLGITPDGYKYKFFIHSRR